MREGGTEERQTDRQKHTPRCLVVGSDWLLFARSPLLPAARGEADRGDQHPRGRGDAPRAGPGGHGQRREARHRAHEGPFPAAVVSRGCRCPTPRALPSPSPVSSSTTSMSLLHYHVPTLPTYLHLYLPVLNTLCLHSYPQVLPPFQSFPILPPPLNLSPVKAASSFPP